jgi:anti-anti-sigma regulatory factor
MTCRINRLLIAEDRVLFSISGRITAEYVDLLRSLLERERSAVAIDLKNVFHVDREAVKLLARCESDGAELRNCTAYLREWITRERADPNA